MNILRALIRPLVATPFILDSFDALRHPRKHSAKIEKIAPTLRRSGLSFIADQPILAARISGALTLAAAAMLATGRAPRTSATALTLLSLPIAYTQTVTEPTLQKKINTAVNRGALTGALVLAALDRKGSPSLLWKASALAEQAGSKAANLRHAATRQFHTSTEKITDTLS
ncbi:DoxX family membrane protein [Actinomycetaceae bacterium TAE3-ERU4]|nr:DoxX family membrane protein [Actinomycetaceae bacterium TAE3-ERU4]